MNSIPNDALEVDRYVKISRNFGPQLYLPSHTKIRVGSVQTSRGVDVFILPKKLFLRVVRRNKLNKESLEQWMMIIVRRVSERGYAGRGGKR